MKLSPDSPELTAYALGELPPDQAAAVEAALREAPELQAEVAALRATADSLASEFAAEPALELAPGQRAAIVTGARLSEPPVRVLSTESPPDGPDHRAPTPSLWQLLVAWRGRLLWLATGACALALSLSILRQQPPPRTANERFEELRYQRLPAPVPEPAKEEAETQLGRSTTPAVTPLAAGERKLTESLVVDSLADAPKDRADSLSVVRTETPAAPTTVTTAARSTAVTPTPAKPQTATGLDLARTPVAAPATPPPAQQSAQLATAPEPALARRYGLAPQPAVETPQLRQSSAAGAGGTPAAGVNFFTEGSSPANNGPQPNVGFVVVPQPKTDGYFKGAETLSRNRGTVTWDVKLQEAEAVRDLTTGRFALTPEEGRREVERRLLFRAPGTEGYEPITDNDFKPVATAPLSTFSLDVDTASYANVRRFLREGSLPPRDAVRLEELINYFRYDYPQPQGEHPFVAAIEIADAPWKEGHKLVRIGLQAKSIVRAERPRANLVFLVDVSGSMEPENKLPLVKRSLRLLLDKLTERDSVGIVTYAGESRVALIPTGVGGEGRQRILEVIESLRSGGSTHGSAGIQGAYALATNRFDAEGVNRVILCTDGDFNVGVTDRGALLDLITTQARSGVFLSVLGYGMGNYKDGTVELLADKGNGNYAYIDSFTEARKVLSEQLEGTLVTVAKDVKVQVEFNPGRVHAYRLLGYENRALRDRDFNDDTKDAGEVGAGHQITVLYEIQPAGPSLAGVDPLRYQAKPVEDEVKSRLKTEHGDELLNFKLRYKAPAGDTSRLVETAVKDDEREFTRATSDFKFAAAVAGYGMMLRLSPHKGDLTWDRVLRFAEQGLGEDKEGYRAEFVDLVRKAQQLGGGK